MHELRSAETAQITKLILAGASASFIGVSGIGKSTIDKSREKLTVQPAK